MAAENSKFKYTFFNITVFVFNQINTGLVSIRHKNHNYSKLLTGGVVSLKDVLS